MVNIVEGTGAVCVVIVNYNGGAMLTECVHSVLLSSMPVRVYVSDNGSTDNSIKYLRAQIGSHPLLKILENGVNLGFAKGNNVVLPFCRCKYVLFLNPDCTIAPEVIEKMIDVMEQHPDAGMAGCLLLNPDGTEQIGCRRFIPTPWRYLVRALKLHKVIRNHPRFQSFSMSRLPLPDAPIPIEAISGAFMMVRREVIETVGRMDEGYFMHCEDLDWCMRFRAAGWKVLFVPHVRVLHWKGLSSAATPIKVEYHKHRGMVRFYNKFFRHQYPAPLMVLVAIAVWTRFVLKTAWIFVLDIFPQQDAGRAARISAETVERWSRNHREEQEAQ